MFFNDQQESYQASEANAAELVDSVTESKDESEAQSADERFDEAERRILLAMHYREAMKSGIFPAGTEAAEVVNKEVADFLRSRLEDLLGMGDGPKVAPPVQVALPFTDDQLAALTMLANSLLKKNAPPSAPAPIEKAAIPELPTIAVAKKATPAQLQTNKAKPPAQSAPAAPTPPKAQPKAKPKAPPKTKQGKIDYDAIEDGKPFEENGVMYQFITHPSITDKDGNPKRIKQTLATQVATNQGYQMPTDKAGIEGLMSQTSSMANTAAHAFTGK